MKVIEIEVKRIRETIIGETLRIKELLENENQSSTYPKKRKVKL